MLTSSKKTSFTYLRRVAILPLLIFTCVLFAFTLKKNDRNLFEKNRADYQTEKNSLNLEEKLVDKFDEEVQDTTYKKKRSNATGVGVDNQDKTVKVDTAASKTKITISTKDSKESVNKVLVVLDGKEMSWKEFEKKEIKPEKIQSMNVLKGESAIAKYGDKGKDGVIEITSKQSTEQTKNNSTPAEFPGGLEEWRKYFFRNTDFKALAEHTAPTGKYMVIVDFIISKDGNTSNAVAETKTGYGTEEEAIRTISKGPKWRPAKKDGVFVDTQVKQTITYTVTKEGWSYVEVNSIIIGNMKTVYVTS